MFIRMVVLETGTKDIKFYGLGILEDTAHDYKDSADRAKSFNELTDSIKNMIDTNMSGGAGIDVAAYMPNDKPLTRQQQLEQIKQLQVEQRQRLEQLKQLEQYLETYVRPIFDNLFYELKFYYFAFSYDDDTVTFGNPVNKEQFLEHFSEKNTENSLYNKFLRILVEKFEKDKNYTSLESFSTKELLDLWSKINEQQGGNDNTYITLPKDNDGVLAGKITAGKAFKGKRGRIRITKVDTDRFMIEVFSTDIVPNKEEFGGHQGNYSTINKAGTYKDIIEKFLETTFENNDARKESIKAFKRWYKDANIDASALASASAPAAPPRAPPRAAPRAPPPRAPAPASASATKSNLNNKQFINIILGYFRNFFGLEDDDKKDFMVRSQQYVMKRILDPNITASEMTSMDETLLRGIENVVSFNAKKMVQDDVKAGKQRPKGSASVNTRLLDDIENKAKEGWMDTLTFGLKSLNPNAKCELYVIDNAGPGNHGFDNRLLCPLSQIIDGISMMTENTCKQGFNIQNGIQDSKSPGKEYGNMLVCLKHDDNHSIELSRIFKPSENLDLKIEFKNGDNKYFTSIMSIKANHNVVYTCDIKGDGIDKTIVSDMEDIAKEDIANMGNKVKMGSNILITAKHIYDSAIMALQYQEDNQANIDKEIRRKIFIATAYSSLVFKSFGDIMQEWNGVLKGGGYVKDEKGEYQAPTYSDNEKVCKHTSKFSESTPLRVMLTGDRPSGARVLWSLYKGKDDWKEYINSNCFGGYVAQSGMNLENEKIKSEETLYTPVHNYFIFNPALNKVYTFKTGNTILRPRGSEHNKEIDEEIKNNTSLVKIPANTRDWASTYHPIVPKLLAEAEAEAEAPAQTTVAPAQTTVTAPDNSVQYCEKFDSGGKTYMLQLIHKQLSNTTVWRITDDEGNYEQGTKNSFVIKEDDEGFKGARQKLNTVKSGYKYDGNDYCGLSASPGTSGGPANQADQGNVSNNSTSSKISWSGDFTNKSYGDFIDSAIKRNTKKIGGIVEPWGLGDDEWKKFLKIAQQYENKDILTPDIQKDIIKTFNDSVNGMDIDDVPGPSAPFAVPATAATAAIDSASRKKRLRQQQEGTFTPEEIKNALVATVGNGKLYKDIKGNFTDNMTLEKINELLKNTTVNTKIFERNLNDNTSNKRRRGKQIEGGAQTAQTARTIQQETYQDPLTYAIVAIGAFAAMMIGLQK